MKLAVQRAALAAALVGLGFWGWRAVFPGPEKVIRHRLTEMAESASFTSNEGPLAKFINAQKLSGFCTPDVELDIAVPGYQRSISGRDELLKIAMMARSAVSSVSVQFPDINVTVAPDKQSAVADVTVRARIGADKDFDVREFSCALKKIDGTWFVSRVHTVRTLRE